MPILIDASVAAVEKFAQAVHGVHCCSRINSNSGLRICSSDRREQDEKGKKLFLEHNNLGINDRVNDAIDSIN